MIPLAVPHLHGNEAKYLHECVQTNWVSSVGPFVDRFEGLVAEAAGVDHCTATASGTAGLHAALLAVGVGRDDLVIAPSFSFIATANAIAHCGADPWLFDVQAESWTLDPEQMESALASEGEQSRDAVIHRATGRRIAAVLPVFTLGVPARMDLITDVARGYGLPVVADAAAALGATLHGRRSGNLDADLTVYSFNGNKTMTAGGGGAVTGSDADRVSLVRHLCTTARVGADYEHDRVGFNYRLTNIAAAVGCAQLERLELLVGAKRRIADRYDRAVAELSAARPFPRPTWAESACWLSGVLLDGPVQPLIDPLRELGVGARSFWRPTHLQTPFATAPCEPLPVTESIWRRILTLPSSAGLSAEDQDTVIEALRRVL